jgi:hypothetical protein
LNFARKLQSRLAVPLLGLLLTTRIAVARDLWDIDDTYIGASIADAAWTINEDFPGTKLIVDGAYLFNREAVPMLTRGTCDCVPAGTRDRILGSVWGHAQWGNGDTQLEYGRIAFSGLSFQTDYELADDDRFQPRTDTWNGAFCA